MSQSVPDQSQSVPVMGQSADQSFIDEQWRFKAALIASKYAPQAVDIISNAAFTLSCKLAFFHVIIANFDQNAVLALNENLILRRLMLELSLNEMVLACEESDTQNPHFPLAQSLILSAHQDFISRSKLGAERKNIGVSERHEKVEYTGLPSQGAGSVDQPPQQQRRGFFGGR